MMACERCGSHGVIRIEVTSRGGGLVFRRCTSGCEARWWQDRAGRPQGRQAVIEAARAVPRRNAAAA